MPSSYDEELDLALRAVHRASIVTKNVMNGIESLDKSDDSPVTMADFAAQALIISAIHSKWPNDRFVAEESADMLRENESLLQSVWKLVQEANSTTEGYSNQLHSPKDPEEMMSMIDLGCERETPSSGRIWILDPVDGTVTFLKGQQYAVCLSFTIDGKQKVGVLGCPNLNPTGGRVEEDSTDEEGYGILLGAILGQGAFQASISKDGLGTRQSVYRSAGSTVASNLQFTDSVKSSHAHLQSHAKVFEKLGLSRQHINIWSMQIKYAALALGTCDAAIRIPPTRDVRASVWDHAGGQLIFTEAGGKITDLDGQEFDFARGRAFGANWGFVAADAKAYNVVFAAVQDVLGSRN